MRRIRFPVFQFSGDGLSGKLAAPSTAPAFMPALGRANMGLGPSAIASRTERPALGRLGRRDTSVQPGWPTEPQRRRPRARPGSSSVTATGQLDEAVQKVL